MEHPIHILEDQLGVESPIWRTRDGQELRMRDMTSMHIFKCIIMIQKKNKPSRLSSNEHYFNLQYEMGLRNFICFLTENHKAYSPPYESHAERKARKAEDGSALAVPEMLGES